MPSEFLWDKATQRYRYKDNGKFVSTEAVRNLTEKYISQQKADIKTIADLLVQDKISVATWEETTARALKNAHVAAYTLGRGGLNQMTARSSGLIGSELKKEYQYLRGFSQDILDGKMTVDRFRARVELYVDSVYGSYELGRAESHRSEGYIWERRYRNSAESCQSCITYAARGWQALGTLPKIGDECECRARCRCHKEYSKERVKPKDSLLSSRWGYVGSSFSTFKPPLSA